MTELELANGIIEHGWFCLGLDYKEKRILANAVVRLTEENKTLSRSFADMNIGLLKYEEALKEARDLILLFRGDNMPGDKALDNWLTKYSALIGGETK